MERSGAAPRKRALVQGDLCKVRRSAISIGVKRKNYVLAKVVQAAESGVFVCTIDEKTWTCDNNRVGVLFTQCQFLKGVQTKIAKKKMVKAAEEKERREEHEKRWYAREEKIAREGFCKRYMSLAESPTEPFHCHGVRVEKEYGLDSGGSAVKLRVCTMASILDFNGDCIVNATNTGCIGGGGLDFAINQAGGQELWQAREKLELLDDVGTRCLEGDAKVTIAGDLQCKNIIHAVGPRFQKYQDDRKAGYDILRRAYMSSLARAQELGATNIAFPIISGGIFRGNERLAPIIEHAIVSILGNAYPSLKEVYFCAFTHEETSAVRELKLLIPMQPEHLD